MLVTALMGASTVLLAAPAAIASSPGPVGRIVFDAGLGNGDSAIFSVNPDGSDRQQLTSGQYTDLGPDVSADGTKIAYSSNQTGHNELWTMNVDGSDQTQLTSDGSSDTYPAWSPNGATIAFRSNQSGNGDIYTIPAAGGAETQLTSAAGLDSAPEWSPDGSKIVFHTVRVDSNPTTCTQCDEAIWVMNANGSDQHQLIGGAGEIDKFPNWSADGVHLVYEHEQTAGEDPSDGIYIANADGTDPVKVDGTNTLSQAPDFAPDGATICFDSAGSNLDTIPVAGGTSRVIVDGNLDVGSTDWSVVPTTTPTAHAPMIGAISPADGPAAGGTTVTITGTNFLDATAVRFGTTAASSFTVSSDEQISAVAPAGSSGGPVDVTITNNTGTSSPTSADTFTYDAPPSVSMISPDAGSTAGGTSVMVTGSDFTGATAVQFGATAAASFTVDNDGQITAVSPPGTGNVDVTVTTTNGASPVVPGDQFTYVAPPTVTGVQPDHGSSAGAATVTLTGTGFTGATGVEFDSTAATAFTVVSDTTITATTPGHPAGAVDVTVTGPYGTSAVSTADHYTYRPAPPALSAKVRTNAGWSTALRGPATGGTLIAIYTTRAAAHSLSQVTAVRVDGVSEKFRLVTGSNTIDGAQLQVQLPAHAAGSVGIVVEEPGWHSPPITFTYTGDAERLKLVVHNVKLNTYSSTTSGPAVGGTALVVADTRVSGQSSSGLSTATDVLVGGVGVPFSYVAPGANTYGEFGQLVFTVPAHVAGSVRIVVVEPGWRSPPMTFTFSGAAEGLQLLGETPRREYRSVTSGPAAGGTALVVADTRVSGQSSSGLSTATDVLVGGVGVPFSYVAPGANTYGEFGQLVFTAPAHVAGAVRIVVVEPGWRSPPMTFTFSGAAEGLQLLGETPRREYRSVTSGPAAGGTALVVADRPVAGQVSSGLSTATDVLVDGVAVRFSYVDRAGDATHFGQLLVTLPAHAAGGVAIVVVEPGWRSPPMTFTYTGAAEGLQLLGETPRREYRSVTSGPAAGGTALVVADRPVAGQVSSGLSTATDVLVDGVAVRFSYVDRAGDATHFGQLLVTLPAHAAGGVAIVVVEPGWRSPPMTFTYTGAAEGLQLLGETPRREYRSVTSGPAAGGTALVVADRPVAGQVSSGLSTATDVLVDGVAVRFSYVDRAGDATHFGQLLVTLPAQPVGPVPIVVEEPGWSSAPLTFTYG